MNCPICAEHNQAVEMVKDKKNFYICPDCGGEVWPPTKYQPTWKVKRVKKKSGSSNRSKRFKNKEKKIIPWYQRTPE